MKTDQSKKRELSFERLRETNLARCEDAFHPLEEWSPTDWATAFGGEAGEALNKVKKLRRLDGADKGKDSQKARATLVKQVAKEVADTVIYGDLLLARLGMDLGEAVAQKFNEVSRRRGSTYRL